MYTAIEDRDTIRKIKSVNTFNNLVKQERYRSDRNNQKFSLVTFDVTNLQTSLINPAYFIDELFSRLRCSDEAGWLNERQIAVLLPETTTDGAQKLVHDFFINRLRADSVPQYNVYMYPSINWNDQNVDGEQSVQSGEVHEKFVSDHRMPVWKRAIDIIGSSIGLLLLSPVLLMVAAVIKFVSPGSVFFRQQRVGKSGKVFTLYKFRTMHENNDTSLHSEYLKKLINGERDEEKPMVKINNDPRIIPFGNIIRSTCLDELPQLFNVLRGDMSLIGPRPPIPYEADEYLRWHTRRFDITPGLTGLWQVSGKNRTTFKEMIRLDIKYAAERSLWLDLKILFKTPLVVVSQIQESLPQITGKSLIIEKVAEDNSYCLEC